MGPVVENASSPAGARLVDVEDKIRSYIVESFLTEPQGEGLGADDDLLKILDSLQILRMVIHIETEFGVKIHDADLVPENIGSVKRIAAFLAGHTKP